MSNITLNYSSEKFSIQVDENIIDITPVISTLHIRQLLRKLNITDVWKDAKNSGFNILSQGDSILSKALIILFGTMQDDPISKDWKSKLNEYKNDIKTNSISQGLFTPLCLERTKSETLVEFKHIQFFMFESGIGSEKLGLENQKEFITAPQLLDHGPSGGNIDKKLKQPDKYWIFPKSADTVNITENAMAYFGFYNTNVPEYSNWKWTSTTLTAIPSDNNIFNCSLQFPYYSVNNVLLSDPNISNYNKGNPTKNEFINTLTNRHKVTPADYNEVIKLVAFKLLGDALMNIIYKIICEYMKSQSSISGLYMAMGHPINAENTLDNQVNIKELVEQRTMMSTNDGTVHSRNIINGVSSLLTGGAHELLMADLFTPTKQSILFVLKTQLEMQMNAIIKNNNELLFKWKAAVNLNYTWMEKQYDLEQTSYFSYFITNSFAKLVSELLIKMKVVCTTYYDVKLAEINELNITDDPDNLFQNNLHEYITNYMLPFLCSPFLQIRYKMVENFEGNNIFTQNGYIMREIEMPAFSSDIQGNPLVLNIINDINQINADILIFRNSRREPRKTKQPTVLTPTIEPSRQIIQSNQITKNNNKPDISKKPNVSRKTVSRIKNIPKKPNVTTIKKQNSKKTPKKNMTKKKRGENGTPMILSDESNMVITEPDNDYLSFNEKYILYYACKLLHIAELKYDENHIEFIYMLYSLTVHFLRINVYLNTINYQDKIDNTIKIAFKIVMKNEPIYMGSNAIIPNIVDSLFESFNNASNNINQNMDTYYFSAYARVLINYFDKISQNDKIQMKPEKDILLETNAVKYQLQSILKPITNTRSEQKILTNKEKRENVIVAKRNQKLFTLSHKSQDEYNEKPTTLFNNKSQVKPNIVSATPPHNPPIVSSTIEPFYKTLTVNLFNKNNNGSK